MHSALTHTAHRPWPLPPGEWRWRQSWLDLAFLHYPCDPGLLRSRLPDGLQLQTFDGTAWLGLVPFRMEGVMRRPFPDLPGFSTFPELNLRTYVERDGKPGVWFFSLDASSRAMVFGGNHLYGLPYHHARMSQEKKADGFHFTSIRTKGDAIFQARYRPQGATFLARPGSFEHWASERYCLYAHSPKRGLTRVEVHHPPWPLQSAEVEILQSTMLEAASFPTPAAPPVAHFSSGVDVLSYGVETLLLS